MFLSIGMLKQKYFLTDIFILSAEKQPIIVVAENRMLTERKTSASFLRNVLIFFIKE